jgi:hypothetical protein
MAKKLCYERYSWFHGRVKTGASPNASHLARRFKISRKQAQRDNYWPISRHGRQVAPRTGAWIETERQVSGISGALVAPRAEAWIVTSVPLSALYQK